MAEYIYNDVQLIQPGASALLETAIGCPQGLVLHRPGSGILTIRGISKNPCAKFARYRVAYDGNIAIPEGETVGPISVAITLDGANVPATEMIVTPAAVEEFFNVSRAANIGVWRGCCETVTITNTSTIPIAMTNANIVITRG